MLAALIEANDIPGGGWVRKAQRSWRTGTVGTPSEEATRAAAVGSITAWKAFEQRSESRWAWLEVIPFVSSQDAASALPHLMDKSIANPSVRIEHESPVDDVALPPELAARAYEQQTDGPAGPGNVKYMFAQVGKYALIVNCSASVKNAWQWSEVATIGTLQRAKLATLGLLE
jgi:hypothetical protein